MSTPVCGASRRRNKGQEEHVFDILEVLQITLQSKSFDMKALVYHGPNDKSWHEVPEPDAIVCGDATTIYGSDLHTLKGDVQEVAKVASPDQRQADWSQYPLVHPIQLRTPHVLHT